MINKNLLFSLLFFTFLSVQVIGQGTQKPAAKTDALGFLELGNHKCDSAAVHIKNNDSKGATKFYQSAIKDYKKAIKENPTSYVIYYRLGIAQNKIKEYKDAIVITDEDEDGKYICGAEIEKMSKSKYNVVNPDDIVDRYGADTFRMYEMFLGPVEQSKPWDTKGIEGVHRFLRKFWRLYVDEIKGVIVTGEPATPAELKVLHKTI